MRQAIDCIVRMINFPFDGQTNLFCDINSVVVNSTRTESTLKRKYNSVAYHRVRESQAGATVRIFIEDTRTNLEDILTALLPGTKLRKKASTVMW